RLERQLHAAEALWLVKAEQSRLVQQLLVFAQQRACVLAGLRALLQHRYAFMRPAHRLLITDAREIASLGLGQRADAHGDDLRCSSTSASNGSSVSAISFSISRPQPGQQNWRKWGRGSMKRFGSPTMGFDAWIGRSCRTHAAL